MATNTMQYACNAIISLSTRGVGCVLYVYGSDTRAALARSAPPGPRAKADLLSSARRASDTGCVWTNSIFDWLSGYYSKLLLSNSNMSFNYIKDSSGRPPPTPSSLLRFRTQARTTDQGPKPEAMHIKYNCIPS